MDRRGQLRNLGLNSWFLQGKLKLICLFGFWENLRRANLLTVLSDLYVRNILLAILARSCVYFFFVPNLVATRGFEKKNVCPNQILQASTDPGTGVKFVLYKQKTSLLSSLWHR